jgi:hypothetical protein
MLGIHVPSLLQNPCGAHYMIMPMPASMDPEYSARRLPIFMTMKLVDVGLSEWNDEGKLVDIELSERGRVREA